MRIIRILLIVVLIPVGAFLLFLLYASADDYRPDEIISESVEREADVIPDSARLDLLIWNIGYAGLDASMDFFYDGGKQMRPAKDGVRANVEGITSTLSDFRECDFVLLQEVDLDSKRSYHNNEVGAISEKFPSHEYYFGMNYDVFFVPIPLKAPYGKVESGLLSLTRHTPSAVDRYSFPGNYAWPKKLFMLDRCFLVERHPVSNGRELLVINTHNSAYDDGSLRRQQMEYLRDFLLSEYEKGNYVIVGGDWNQTPYGFEPAFTGHPFDTVNLTYVEKDYPAADWTWAFDRTLPTNRRVALPYDRATSLTTVIDCYLLSPNILMEEVRNMDLDFRFSDHQPVRLQVRLHPG
jgi:endonuclease/exonuclease/phosphatase family metal-dependent hydrolase